VEKVISVSVENVNLRLVIDIQDRPTAPAIAKKR